MTQTPTTLGTFLPQYALQRSLGVETLRQYRVSVSLFEIWAKTPPLLSELCELQISEWLRTLAATRAPATVRSKRTQLLALWRAAADDYLCEPPRRRVRSQRCPWKPPVAFSREELVQLVAECRSLPRVHPCGLRRSVWWELALRVAWDSGLRFGDMVALRVDQISPVGMLVVPQSKTGRIVVVRLSARTMDLARLSVAIAPRGVLLPWAASHETFAAQFRLLTRKAGVRPGQWKWIRRGSATDVELQSPGAASAHLGHAPGSQIAARNYLDPLLLMRCGVGPRCLEETPPPPPPEGVRIVCGAGGELTISNLPDRFGSWQQNESTQPTT